MKIEYACLHGYKRLQNSHIKELECEFPNPVQIIVGSNSSGKTSLIRELSPLPSVRTDYEKDGYKELHISHDNHSYVLKSDFSNRTSPHSFMVDDIELNVGHTSQVQEELVVKHFGFTPAVRDLVYGKTKMCSMTPVNRKNMFLNLNPMDLTLILSAFKTSYAIFKDSKANVNLLNQRKASLEAAMIPEDVLATHIKTKNELESELLELEKTQYLIANYLTSVKSECADDIIYYNNCITAGTEVVPKDTIVATCRAITARTPTYTEVSRTQYVEDRAKYTADIAQLSNSLVTITSEISQLNTEIDEYRQHIAKLSVATPDKLQSELEALDAKIASYKNLPVTPLTQEQLSVSSSILDTVSKMLEYWHDLHIRDFDQEDILNGIVKLEQVSDQLKLLQDRAATIYARQQELAKDIEQNLSKANIPPTCNNTECGLRKLFTKRYEEAKTKLAQVTREYADITTTITEVTTIHTTLVDKYAVHKQYDTPKKFTVLVTTINKLLPVSANWSEEVVAKELNDTFKILHHLTTLIESSVNYYAQQEYVKLRQIKDAELQATLKSAASVDTEFLQQQIKNKQEQVIAKRNEYAKISKQIAKLRTHIEVIDRYRQDRELLTQLTAQLERGERALVTHATITHWENEHEKLVARRKAIHTKLGELSALVKEQEVIKRTYESETIALLAEVKKKMELHEAINSALSPNSGLVHKSMVNYLNAMVEHVNYFIDELWSFKLQMMPLDIAKPLTYQFPICIGEEVASDINHLSDGQTEIVDFTWCLAILLQLKMLNRIPLYADELGRACDLTHRNRILAFLNSLVDNQLVEQVFLINHYAALQDGFTNSDIICLNEENLGELPTEVNSHCKFVKF